MKMAQWCVALFVMGSLAAAWAGDLKPMLQSNSFKPLVKSETRNNDTAQWFPTNIYVVISNKVFYVFRSEYDYHVSKLRGNPTQLVQGGFLTLFKPYSPPCKFRIHSITTNYIVLGVQGSLNLKKVPVNILDQFE